MRREGVGCGRIADEFSTVNMDFPGGVRLFIVLYDAFCVVSTFHRL
jgi:hypothetical protein